jgi:hypothetical protein
MSKLTAALERGAPLDDPNIMAEDDPPMLRFERGTLENRHITEETGRYAYKDAIFVHVRSYGDIKTEVPYVVRTTVMVPTLEEFIVRKKIPIIVRQKVTDEETGLVTTQETTEYEERDTTEERATYTEEEITPWLTQLDERLRNGRISQEYRDYCFSYFDKWEATGEVPIDGHPVSEWNMPSEAQKRQLIDAGINTVERVAEMNEDAMQVVGMGGRDLKKKAGTWLLAGQDQNRSAAQVIALESKADQKDEEMANMQQGYEAEISRLKAEMEDNKIKEKADLQAIASRKGRPTDEMKDARERLKELEDG